MALITIITMLISNVFIFILFLVIAVTFSIHIYTIFFLFLFALPHTRLYILRNFWLNRILRLENVETFEYVYNTMGHSTIPPSKKWGYGTHLYLSR